MSRNWTNKELANDYYYTFALSQAFSRPSAQQYLRKIETGNDNIAAYFEHHRTFEGLGLDVDRRTLGLLQLILTQGADKAKEQVRGTTIAVLDRLLEEVLEPGRAERIETLYASAA